MLLSSATLPPGWYLFGATAAIGERQFAGLSTDVSRLVATIATANGASSG